MSSVQGAARAEVDLDCTLAGLLEIMRGDFDDRLLVYEVQLRCVRTHRAVDWGSHGRQDI